MKLSSVIIAGVIACTACMPKEVPDAPLTDVAEIHLAMPSSLKKKLVREDGSVFYSTIDADMARYRPSDVVLELYSDSSPVGCSIIGVSAPQTITFSGGTAVWGRVDAYDHEWVGDSNWIKQDPHCKQTDPHQGAEYVLCSECDGQRVVICLDQMQSDAAGAERLFSTFQWGACGPRDAVR